MLQRTVATLVASLALAATLGGSPAVAASCGNTASGFSSWLSAFKQRAASQGISARTLDTALAGVSYDSKVIHLDRNQHSFKLSFSEFYRRRVDSAMIAKGRRLMQTHAGTLNAIEKRFGVPGAVVVAIWGLETAYGAQRGAACPLSAHWRRSPTIAAALPSLKKNSWPRSRSSSAVT